MGFESGFDLVWFVGMDVVWFWRGVWVRFCFGVLMFYMRDLFLAWGGVGLGRIGS